MSKRLVVPGCNCAYCQFVYKVIIFEESDCDAVAVMATRFDGPEDQSPGEFFVSMDDRATVREEHHKQQWH